MDDAKAGLALSTVTALLASGPGSPGGDTSQGLEMTLVLEPDGQVGVETYHADPRPWRVRRFRPDRPDWTGELVREDEAWALRGEPAEDGPIWFLELRAIRPGAYLTLRRPDGEELVFRVVGVARSD